MLGTSGRSSKRTRQAVDPPAAPKRALRPPSGPLRGPSGPLPARYVRPGVYIGPPGGAQGPSAALGLLPGRAGPSAAPWAPSRGPALVQGPMAVQAIVVHHHTLPHPGEPGRSGSSTSAGDPRQDPCMCCKRFWKGVLGHPALQPRVTGDRPWGSGVGPSGPPPRVGMGSGGAQA